MPVTYSEVKLEDILSRAEKALKGFDALNIPKGQMYACGVARNHLSLVIEYTKAAIRERDSLTQDASEAGA